MSTVSLELLSDFALSLRRESNVEGSSIASPLTVGLILALLHAGANGATKTQIVHALAKSSKDDEVHKIFEIAMAIKSATDTDKIEVSLANRLYVRADVNIEPSYLETIRKNYAAFAQILDFAKSAEAVETMNKFVDETTKGKIKDIFSVETISSDTAAVFVSAIYFKGKWKIEFETKDTRNEDFFSGNGAKRKVDMMHQTDDYMYAETNEVQVLSMKYVDESYSFDVFLPKENAAGGLDAFLAKFNGAKLQTLLKSRESRKVQVSIPKGRIETSKTLNDALMKLGIKDIFNVNAADLSGISKDPAKALFVTHIAHKAFIEMDEEGTTAADSAYAPTTYGCDPREPVVFNANRPYLFVLSKNDAPLFIGVYR